MKRIFFLFLFVLSASCIIFSQSLGTGKVKIKEEPGIREAINRSKRNYGGYRIQVFSGGPGDRRKAEGIRGHVENTFGVNAYVIYDDPNFRVRVGDFIEKIEAASLKYQLSKMYPQSYIVREKRINISTGY